jgi:uncharacterized protein
VTRTTKRGVDFEADTRLLAERIRDSSFQPSLLVALSRGGFVPTRLLSTFLHVKMITAIGIAYKSPKRDDLEVFSFPSLAARQAAILLVQDCLQSGRTLALAKTLLQPHAEIVRTCSVYKLGHTKESPDYVAEIHDELPMLPWE